MSRRRRGLLLGDGLAPETTALLARMSSQPNATRQGQIDTLIKALKNAGVWLKLDLLYVMAAADAQAAQLNWVSSSFNLTAVNSPIFTTDRGYAGDGATSYLSTGFNPNVGTPAYVLNSATFGEYVLTDTANTNQDSGDAAGRASIRSRTLTAAQGRINQSSGTLVAATGTAAAPRHVALSRTASNLTTIYIDGAADGTTAAVSTSMGGAFDILRNVGGGTPTFSDRQIAATYAGSGLIGSELSALHSALRAYLQAVGAA